MFAVVHCHAIAMLAAKIDEAYKKIMSGLEERDT